MKTWRHTRDQVAEKYAQVIDHARSSKDFTKKDVEEAFKYGSDWEYKRHTDVEEVRRRELLALKEHIRQLREAIEKMIQKSL